jgi:predicted Zn-dependent protease with MMP-like domain
MIDEMPPMDPLSAHIDRGWEHIENGDLHAAEKSARRVLEMDGSAPEAHTLLGAIASARGEAEEALEHYKKAIDLDPEYIDPVLCAAELCMGPLEDLEAADRYADIALDLAEEEEEYVDALLLKAEIAVVGEEPEAAAAVLDELPDVELPEPPYEMRAGHLWLEIGDLDRAEKHLRRAVAADPELADAWYDLGLVLEERDDTKGRIEIMQRVRTLDLREPEAAWAFSDDEFDAIVEAALEEIPVKSRGLIANVPVQVDDYPSQELVGDGLDPRLLGVFSGTSIAEKSTLGASAHLDVIVLFKRNIHRVAQTREEAREEIRITLLHETGHFFGLEEEALHEMGLG